MALKKKLDILFLIMPLAIIPILKQFLINFDLILLKKMLILLYWLYY